jgi:hypothetical protein
MGCAELPYVFLALALFALLVSETINQTVHGSWIGDYWEHAAVIRELTHHPFDPTHPLFALNAPNQFFSPYAVGLGLFARVIGLSAGQVLAVAGIGNILLLLSVLPSFVGLFSRQKRAAFYSLLFMLLLWGQHPWLWSGFLHLDVLGLAVPYPSTFATALAMWILVAWTRYLDSPSVGRIVFVACGSAVVLLTHPPVAAFLFVALAAFAAERPGTLKARLRPLALVVGVALGGAILWPYYPFLTLLREQHVFDASNVSLYRGVLSVLFPLLLVFLVLPGRLRVKSRDPLVVSIVCLVAMYVAGWVLARWSLGRVLPLMVILLDVALADRISQWQLRVRRPRVLGAGVVAAVLLLAWIDMSLRSDVTRAIPGGGGRGPGYYYSALLERLPPGNVVMSSLSTGWEVPAYGGRIVASLHPEAFVADSGQREQAVATFFGPATSDAERRLLMSRYGARYVLVSHTADPAYSTLLSMGRVVGDTGGYVLLEAPVTVSARSAERCVAHGRCRAPSAS